MSAGGDRMLGRYRLEALVGRGGMAEVWRAADTKLGRTVAVKVIHAAHAEDRSFVERFLREARLVASVEHPNILPVYDFGEEGGRPFLVMPHLEGGTLRDRMLGRPASLSDAADWISQLAGGLDAAHGAGILHRDVKPANVLVGRGDRLFLADFGIAKLLETQGGLTATGMVVGTPLYMAPEQAQGKPATAATDRYALAVIAYELLAGSPPFEGENPLSLMHQHVSSPPPVLSTKVRGLPAGLDSVLDAALSKDPAARPPSCRALADAIAMYLPTGVARTAPATPAWPPTAASTSAKNRETRRAVSTPAPALTDEKTVVTIGGRRKVRLVAGLGIVVALSAAAAGLLLMRGNGTAPAAAGGVATPVAGSPGASPEVPSKVEEPGSESAVSALATLSPPPAGSPSKHSSASSPSSSTSAIGPTPPAAATAVPAGVSRAAALQRLEAIRKPTRRLSADDFEFARETARRILKNRPESPEADYLEAYGGGGLDYVAGRDAAAGQTLLEAFLRLKKAGRHEVKPIAFLLRSPDGRFEAPSGWELALAYGDARGEAESLLEAARARAPENARLLVGFAGLRRLEGREAEARELLRAACQKGVVDACREAGAERPAGALRRRAPASR